MTEIPEHLLRRSKDRRKAMGLPGGEDDAPAAAAPAGDATPGGGAAAEGQAAAPVSATPAVPARDPNAPAPLRPSNPQPADRNQQEPTTAPLPAHVAAAVSRPKIPFWVMPVVAFLPVWGFLYYNSLTVTEDEAEGPLALGSEVYDSNCASCHSGNGSGGVGRPLWNGEVILTFPEWADQAEFIRAGSPEAGTPYGDPERPGGPHIARDYNGAPMPAFGEGVLSDEELFAVVCHERYGLSGETPSPECLGEAPLPEMGAEGEGEAAAGE